MVSCYRKEKKSRSVESRGSKGEDSRRLNRLVEVQHANFHLSAFLRHVEKSDGKAPENLITANMYQHLTECMSVYSYFSSDNSLITQTPSRLLVMTFINNYSWIEFG